jgi:hypothetical protein
MRAFLAAAAITALTLACNQSQDRTPASEQSTAEEDTTAALAGIDSLVARFAAAANRDDAAAVAATYSDSSLGIADGAIWIQLEPTWKRLGGSNSPTSI